MDGPSRSVEDVFKDYRSRRAGLIKALTTGFFSSLLSLTVLVPFSSTSSVSDDSSVSI